MNKIEYIVQIYEGILEDYKDLNVFMNLDEALKWFTDIIRAEPEYQYRIISRETIEKVIP